MKSSYISDLRVARLGTSEEAELFGYGYTKIDKDIGSNKAIFYKTSTERSQAITRIQLFKSGSSFSDYDRVRSPTSVVAQLGDPDFLYYMAFSKGESNFDVPIIGFDVLDFDNDDNSSEHLAKKLEDGWTMFSESVKLNIFFLIKRQNIFPICDIVTSSGEWDSGYVEQGYIRLDCPITDYLSIESKRRYLWYRFDKSKINSHTALTGDPITNVIVARSNTEESTIPGPGSDGNFYPISSDWKQTAFFKSSSAEDYTRIAVCRDKGLPFISRLVLLGGVAKGYNPAAEFKAAGCVLLEEAIPSYNSGIYDTTIGIFHPFDPQVNITHLALSNDKHTRWLNQKRGLIEIPVDLNSGNSGQVINLWYGKILPQDGDSNQTIVSIYVAREDEKESLENADNKMKPIEPNLNINEKGSDLYVYYGALENNGRLSRSVPEISEIEITAGYSRYVDLVKRGFSRISVDLNRHAGGKDIFIWIRFNDRTFLTSLEITDSDISEDNQNEINYFNRGYIKLGNDLNKSTTKSGASNIYLWMKNSIYYKYGQAIADIAVSSSSSEVNQLMSEGFTQIHRDINHGARGDDLFLWYKINHSPGTESLDIISRIMISYNDDTEEAFNAAGLTKIERDLNSGASADDKIFLWYDKRTIEKHATWMEDLYLDPNLNFKDKTLHTITIPGTHNSGTYSLSRQSIAAPYDRYEKTSNNKTPEFIVNYFKSTALNWSVNQFYDILAQLNAGIRYFDFRLFKNQITHTLLGSYISEVISPIMTFLNGKKEIIILDFQSMFSMENMSQDDKNMFLTSFNGLESVLARSDVNVQSKIGEFINRGYKVVVIVPKEVKKNQFSDIEWLWSREDGENKRGVNSPYDKKLHTIEGLLDYSTKKLKGRKLDATSRLYVTQGILTADSQTIIRSLLPGLRYYKNLSEWSINTTEAVINEIPSWPYEKLNIVMVDMFHQNRDFVPSIIENNRDNCKI